MSPHGSTKTPRVQGLTSAVGEAEQPVQPGTMERVEVPQPQVAAPIGDEAHQPPGLEPVEATSDEGVHSTRDDPSAAAPSTPAPEAPATSAQQAEEGDVVSVTGPGT